MLKGGDVICQVQVTTTRARDRQLDKDRSGACPDNNTYIVDNDMSRRLSCQSFVGISGGKLIRFKPIILLYNTRGERNRAAGREDFIHGCSGTKSQ